MNSPYTHRQYTYLFNSHYILSNVNNTSRIIEADQLRDGQNPLTRISKMICKFSSLTQYGKQMFHLCRTHILWLRASGRWRLKGCRIHTIRLSPRQNRNPERSGASDRFILVSKFVFALSHESDIIKMNASLISSDDNNHVLFISNAFRKRKTQSNNLCAYRMHITNNKIPANHQFRMQMKCCCYS